MVPKIGGSRLVSSVTKRNCCISGKICLPGIRIQRKQSSSKRTERRYCKLLHDDNAGMFQFAADHGYLEANPFQELSLLKEPGQSQIR